MIVLAHVHVLGAAPGPDEVPLLEEVRIVAAALVPLETNLPGAALLALDDAGGRLALPLAVRRVDERLAGGIEVAAEVDARGLARLWISVAGAAADEGEAEELCKVLDVVLGVLEAVPGSAQDHLVPSRRAW